MAGAPGFEPGLCESKSHVLPLHNAPIKQDTLNYFALPIRRLAKARKTGFEPAIQDVPILFAVCVLNFGDLRRIRTYVSWLRTRCPSPLDE